LEDERRIVACDISAEKDDYLSDFVSWSMIDPKQGFTGRPIPDSSNVTQKLMSLMLQIAKPTNRSFGRAIFKVRFKKR
jgi:hypothetical protein